MIECHTFNSLVRLDLRQSSGYMLSQFVGGMASVLFLFLAGVTFAFQMDRLDRRGATAAEKLQVLVRRSGYVLGVAFLFRISNTAFSWHTAPWRALLKVDILNCMGASMLLIAVVGLLPRARRAQWTALAAVALACASPLVSAVDWSGVPWLVRDYLAPNRKVFALFPWSAYLVFGVAGGTVLRGMGPERLDRGLQWAVLLGFGLVLGGQYFSNLPYSLYDNSEFWLNSPGLVVIRVGLVLLTLAAAYLWTEHGAGSGWSGLQAFGKTSLLVYWVHVVLVYGQLADPWKKALTIPQAVVATLAVIALMLVLSEARLRWAARSRPRAMAQTTAA